MSKKEPEYIENEFYVMISGKRACFTDPLFRVERRSLDFITPGSAQAILSKVYAHPGVTWKIEEIRVINQIQMFTQMTNEVKNFRTIKFSDVINAIDNKEFEGVNPSENRLQRNSTILVDVKYIVKAKLVRSKNPPPDFKFELKKYISIFLRRMEKETFYMIPHLGLREFPAELELIPKTELSKYTPIDRTVNYGLLLHHVDMENGEFYLYPAFMDKGIVNCNESEVDLTCLKI